MTTNRSTEELEIRKFVTWWGRKKWPGARVVHELVVGSRRIDMAFVLRGHLVGVEIKGPKDRLDRLDAQIKTFRRHLPELWIAYDPKWHETLSGYYGQVGRVAVDVTHPEGVIEPWGSRDSTIDRTVTAPMLHLLWRSEALSVASRMRVKLHVRTPLYRIVPALARALTGDEIVKEVCRELRARDAFPDHPPSDAPIRGAATE